MYDPKKLKLRMAALGMNYVAVAKKAGVNWITAKRIIETGKGQPRTVKLVARALKFRDLAEIVRRG